MTKEEYGEALKTTMWKKKRDIILKRDKYTCTKCRSKKCLHVHHTYYLKDKMPWAVPDDCLVTLCEVCHEKEHIKKHISTFVRRTIPKKKEKRVKPKKVCEKLKKLRFYKFLAIKDPNGENKVYDKTVDWKLIPRPLPCEVKGFDDRALVEKWLRTKKKRSK